MSTHPTGLADSGGLFLYTNCLFLTLTFLHAPWTCPKSYKSCLIPLLKIELSLNLLKSFSKPKLSFKRYFKYLGLILYTLLIIFSHFRLKPSKLGVISRIPNEIFLNFGLLLNLLKPLKTLSLKPRMPTTLYRIILLNFQTFIFIIPN